MYETPEGCPSSTCLQIFCQEPGPHFGGWGCPGLGGAGVGRIGAAAHTTTRLTGKKIGDP